MKNRAPTPDIQAQAGWDPFESAHAMDSAGVEYDHEIYVMANSGRILAAPAGNCCDYVRIIDQGREIAYWSVAEWQADASDVLGAIAGSLCGRAARMEGEDGSVFAAIRFGACGSVVLCVPTFPSPCDQLVVGAGDRPFISLPAAEFETNPARAMASLLSLLLGSIPASA